MKLNKIQADNFLKLNLFEVDLSNNIVHLFAGGNEAGKSSVQEAVRFALTGETIRVSAKVDYKLMIRDGAKSGSVSVNLDGVDVVRDIKTGQERTPDSETINLPEFLPYLLNAQQFANQNKDKRRSFLINLTGTSVKADDIKRRMLAKNVDETCIDMVLPMLRSGFTATHKEALNRATEARQQWTGLTGNQRYGSQIAANWKPEIPEEFDHKAYLSDEKSLEDLKTKVDQMNIKKGGLISRLDEAKDADTEGEPVKFSQASLNKLNKKIESAKDDLFTLEASHKDMNDRYYNAKEGAPVTCCKCGSLLKVEFSNDGAKGRVATCEPFSHMSEDDMQHLQSEIFRVGKESSDQKRLVVDLDNEAIEMLKAKAAAKTKKEADVVDVAGMTEKLNTLNENIEKANAEYSELNSSIVNDRVIAERIADAEKITIRARELHNAVERWSFCAETLAPDGIPAEILSDTLKPVNKRLRNTSSITGWDQVSIDPTMEIMVEGRRYSLLSESAKWRADSAIADAISYLSGLGIMVIDRMDVLDIPGRAQFMKWISKIKSDYETVLIFGTLKSRPTLPEGMESYWIVNGEIDDDL